MRRLIIPIVIVILGLLSVVTLSSIAPGLAPKQLVFFLIGLGIFLASARVPFNRFVMISGLAYIGLCALLVITLIIGKETRNTARWIDVGGLFVIQGSQLAIPVVALLVSKILTVKNHVPLKKLLVSLALIGLPALLVLVAPDLGTTLAFLASVSATIFFAKTKSVHLLALVLSGIMVGTLAWNFVLHDYQKQRITSFMDAQDVKGASYNARQALIAVGSGGVIGKGLGQGVQSHLRFLPERQTDFIFASFSEEFGFVGTMVLFVLYTLLVTAILRISLAATSETQRLFGLSAATMIVAQAGINIGMNIGLLPITGITLPLVSYGGSSILSICGTLGIVQSIAIHQHRHPERHIS